MAILKDGGYDLNKGVKLYIQSQTGRWITVLDDIGHVAANALKAAFAKHWAFIKFLDIVRKGAARIRQTNLVYFLPPKIRTKGRFQSITKLANWAEKLLNYLHVQGRAQKDSELALLRKAFPGLSHLKNFLSTFCQTCQAVEEFLRLLKIQGLNQTTYRQAKEILQNSPIHARVKKRLMQWLEEHLTKHCRLAIGQMPLLVSSDALESLFGKFKTVIQRNDNAELNRLVYIMPLICGRHTVKQLNEAIQNCSHQEMMNKLQQTIQLTIRQRRRKALSQASILGPKTGPPTLALCG